MKKYLLLCEQCCDVTQCLFCAVLVVAVFADETLLNDGNFLARVVVGASRRGHESQYVTTLLEQVLLDRLAHARVTDELELLAGLESDHGLADDLLPERQLARVGDLDLLLDRAQETLIGGPRLAGNGIRYLAVIERSLDLVQIFL